ncbi:phosphatidylinositol phospholipase C [Fragilaria crotonensis]|nr:phosphatidylinositol phospholipase C [Fragilaria crotonensis]
MRRMQDAIDEYPLVSSESKVIRVNETHRVAFVPVIVSVSVEVDGKMTPEPFEIYAQIGAFFAFKHFNERNGAILPWLPTTLERCDLFLETAFRDSSFNPLKAAKSYFDFVTGNREHSLQHMSPLPINCCSTSTETQLVSILGNAWDVPIISNHASSPSLDDAITHPDLTLLYPTDSGDSTAVVAWFSLLGATHFACLYVRDEFGIAFNLAVTAEAILANMTVVSVPYDQGATREDIRVTLSILAKTNVRYVFLVSFGITTTDILQEASRAGVSGDDGYVWLLQELSNFEMKKDEDESLIRAMAGIGRIERQVPQNPKFYDFMTDFQFNLELQKDAIAWMSHEVDPTFFEEDFAFSTNAPLVSAYTAFSYDAFMTIGLGACSIKKDFPTQAEMRGAIPSLDFEGVTGVGSTGQPDDGTSEYTSNQTSNDATMTVVQATLPSWADIVKGASALPVVQVSVRLRRKVELICFEDHSLETIQQLEQV